MHKGAAVVVLAVAIGLIAGAELGLVSRVAGNMLQFLATVCKLTLISVPMQKQTREKCVWESDQSGINRN